MAFDRESILCLTADAVFTRYIFRRDAHVTPFKRVTQHRQHSVDRNDIPHFRAPAGTGQHMRRAAHAFRTTRNGNVTFAQCDHRSEEHTSELQSLMRNSYAVFCLKKKKQIKDTKTQIIDYITTKPIKSLIT